MSGILGAAITPNVAGLTNPTNLDGVIAFAQVWNGATWVPFTGGGITATTTAPSVFRGNRANDGGLSGAIKGTPLDARSVIKASAGNVFGWQLQCVDTVNNCFVQVYDAATFGAVTLGTTVPKYTIPLLAGFAIQDYLGAPIFSCAAGIVWAATQNFDGSGGEPATPPKGALLFL